MGQKHYLNPLNFSNPKATRFLAAFAAIPTENSLVSALVDAADSTNFVEPSTAANTLIAAEIVAASLGHPAVDFPVELLRLVQTKLPVLKGFKILAIDAVSVVMDSVQDSVATQAESIDFSSWEAAQQNLLHRLA